MKLDVGNMSVRTLDSRTAVGRCVNEKWKQHGKLQFTPKTGVWDGSYFKKLKLALWRPVFKRAGLLSNDSIGNNIADSSINLKVGNQI